MANLWKPLRRALLPMAVLGFAACQGERTPLSPEAAAPPLVEVNGIKLVTVQSGRILAPADGGGAVLVNSQQGATITSGDARFIVPAGAVSTGTKITMEPLNRGYIEFKFGPSGLVFNTPATLTIYAAKANLAGIDPLQLRIAGASDNADDWQVIGGTYDPATDSVSVPISHFSRYALCVE